MIKADMTEQYVMPRLEALKAVPMEREDKAKLDEVVEKLKWHFAGLRASRKKGVKRRIRAGKRAARTKTQKSK
jgi:hypothetical protein